MNADPGQSLADTVIGFAETHLQTLYPWQRDLIRWAFRGDGHQPLVTTAHHRRSPPLRHRESPGADTVSA